MQFEYKETDKNQKLREVVEGTLIFEFPTLYIVIK